MKETRQQLLRRLAIAEEVAEERRQHILELEGSSSWRMTRPLRALSDRLRGAAPAERPSPAPIEAPNPVPSGGVPAAEDAESGLGGRPWRTGPDPPTEVMQIPAMIIDDERRLLHWLAWDYWSGEGKILDAGSYLGASTAALASGLAARGEPPSDWVIASYDRFVLDYFMLAQLPPESELDEGDSFRAIFDHNLAPYAGLVDVREGDLAEIGWSGEPIEIAFFDVLKTWPLSDFALRTFYPAMIPGRTVIVQEDFVSEFCPWVHVTMGLLDPYVELLDLLEWGSAVYLVREPIPDEVLQTRTARDLTPEEIVAHMDTAIAPATGEVRGTLEVAKGTLLRWVDGFDAMEAHLDRVEAEYEGSYRVVRSCEIVRAWGMEMSYNALRLRGKRDPASAISPPA